ncbi:MAG: hypothetical protein R3218_02600 [Christiangramia sp.]|nr:hypothetical protein [Christiangramia sp.]
MKKLCWIGLIISLVASTFSCEPDPQKKTMDSMDGSKTVQFDCNP